jgi:hypothetical protein
MPNGSTKRNTKIIKRHQKKGLFHQKHTRGMTNILLLMLMVFLIFLAALFIDTGSPLFLRTNGPLPSGAVEQNTQTGGGLFILTSPQPVASQAATRLTTQKQCKLITNDVVILIDNSGSMRGNKLAEAKVAASLFVDLISINPQSRVGLVVFSKESKVFSPITSDFAGVKAKINSINSASNTCIQCGALQANQLIGSSLREEVKRSIVLLSDGKSNHTNGKADKNANQKAMEEIKKGFTTSTISYYTIAFGTDANSSFMIEAATSTNGLGYASATEQGLQKAFTQAASDICQSEDS